MRLASDKAKLGFNFSKLALHPGMAASFFVPKDKIDLKRRASYQSSKDLSMEEELLSAGSKGSVRSRSNGTKKSN